MFEMIPSGSTTICEDILNYYFRLDNKQSVRLLRHSEVTKYLSVLFEDSNTILDFQHLVWELMKILECKRGNYFTIKNHANCLRLIFTAHKQPCSSLGRHGDSSREKLQQKELLRGDIHTDYLQRYSNTSGPLLMHINLAFSRAGKKSKPIGGLLQWHGNWSNVWDSEKGLRPWILQVIWNFHFIHGGLCFFLVRKSFE